MSARDRWEDMGRRQREMAISALAAQNLSAARIAAELGTTRNAVLGVAHRTGGGLKGMGSVEVPSWVPTKLIDGYLSRADDHGEEAAAAWARKAKQTSG